MSVNIHPVQTSIEHRNECGGLLNPKCITFSSEPFTFLIPGLMYVVFFYTCHIFGLKKMRISL